MVDFVDFPNAVGLAAGTLLLVSGFPVLWEQLKRSKSAATAGERRSRLMMALGNGLWVIAGIISSLYAVTLNAVTLMCAINALINLEIWRRMKYR